MRSRPTLEVRYSPRHPRAGQRITLIAILTGHSRTPIDRVCFRFTGRETRMYSAGKTATWTTRDRFDLTDETEGLELDAGQHVAVERAFTLPKGLPPSFSSAVSTIEYLAEVRVDIPWWPDRTARYHVYVRPEPAEAKRRRTAAFAASREDEGIKVELTVEGGGHTLGEELEGAVAADRFAPKEVRRIEVSVIAVEGPAGPSHVGPHEVFRSQPITFSLPEPGHPYPFRYFLPNGPVPSFRGKVVQVRWLVEARAVVRHGRDTVVRSELQVAESRKPAPKDEGPPPRVAPLGRERRAQAWASAARHTGLQLDAETETMTGAVGAVRLTIALELHQRRLRPIAQLDWPDVGLGLTLAERKWTDALRGAVALGDAAFDARFAARGQRADAVKALFPAPLRALLAGFARVAIDDEGAVLGAEQLGVGLAPLEAFVKAVQKTARALSGALDDLPAPEPLGPHRAAWRAFAAKHGGHFQPACFAVRGARFKGEPVELVTAFDGDGKPEATWARVRVSRRGAVTPAAKQRMASMARELDGLRRGDDAIEARLPCPLPDPTRAEAVWRALARVAEAG